jgi:hypothetical protein
MDWKPWYRAEAESNAGRAWIAAAIARWPDGDPDVRTALRSGGAVSFPHTTLRDSADPLARVATSIVAERSSRVVALGVLHGSTAPEPERALFTAAERGDVEARARVGGAFTLGGDVATPFGVVPAGSMPPTGPWVRPGGRLLSNEFSLDLFVAVLAAAATARRAPAPAVTRVFIGPTIPDDSNDAAMSVVHSIAVDLRLLLDPGVALVATGDLVHAGHGYAAPEEVAALRADAAELTSYFQSRVAAMLDGTLAGGAAARAADGIAREIRSDMRHVLPVLAALLGKGARARMLSFQWTDYGPILGQPPPCVVASSLVELRRSGA